MLKRNDAYLKSYKNLINTDFDEIGRFPARYRYFMGLLAMEPIYGANMCLKYVELPDLIVA